MKKFIDDNLPGIVVSAWGFYALVMLFAHPLVILPVVLVAFVAMCKFRDESVISVAVWAAALGVMALSLAWLITIDFLPRAAAMVLVIAVVALSCIAAWSFYRVTSVTSKE